MGKAPHVTACVDDDSGAVMTCKEGSDVVVVHDL